MNDSRVWALGTLPGSRYGPENLPLAGASVAGACVKPTLVFVAMAWGLLMAGMVTHTSCCSTDDSWPGACREEETGQGRRCKGEGRVLTRTDEADQTAASWPSSQDNPGFDVA